MQVTEVIAAALGAVVVIATTLSLVRAKAWWVRIWDFPRLQVSVVGSLALGFWIASGAATDSGRALVAGAIIVAVAYQLGMVWRYTRLAPREVQRAERPVPGCRVSLVVSNVLQTNRKSDLLIRTLREVDADIILCLETDEWWHARLNEALATHPHRLECPLPNTYGMLLYSRLPLEETAIEFLVETDVPSMQAKVCLGAGPRVWLNCVHPKPPAPGESDESTERDAELILVGRRVCDAALPVIVCGDLNDVAWSRTTRLFQKISGLVDPRKGRGFFSTFHARYPGLRYPLDHVFHSSDLRLIEMRRLSYVGSDHFPMYAALSYEPAARAEQEAPAADGDDEREAADTVRRGAARQR